MKQSKFKTALLFLCLLVVSAISAQDVRDVDVKSLSDEEIKKAQNAIKDSGMSEEDAIKLARQRGATEEQIREYRERLENGDIPPNTVGSEFPFEMEENKSEDKNPQISEREVEFDMDSRIFGAKLFNSKNLSFEPLQNIQTPKNYEIGIGDEIIISIWGNSQNNYQLKVNPSGQILIPDVGPVFIAGLSFNTAENRIKQRLTEIYADMGGNNPGTFAQINMGQLRSIQVHIVGEVSLPGTYTLPVTASVFNALYLSGGPNQIGSFRNIKVIRDNKTEKIVDIYKFLIDADGSANVLLKDNDVVFVPPAEKRVMIGGEFMRNGVFELKESDMLSELIHYVGGFTENAYTGNIQIRRKTQQGEQLLDISSTQFAITPMVNGDSVSSDTIVNIDENVVNITGAVYRPGDYEWKEGMSLFELIKKADNIKPDAYTNRAIIKRFNADHTTSTIHFDVNQVTNQTISLELQPRDSIFIKSHFDIGEEPYISISGEVMSPGEIPWSKNTSVGDVLFMAGGFTEAADSSFIEISRRLNPEEASKLSDTLVHVFVINHNRNLKDNDDVHFKLEPFDHISVRRAPGYREQGRVSITGEVVYAGVYALQHKHIRISDLVNLAQGITPQAFVDGATLQRNTSELGSENIAINLKNILQTPGQGDDLFLKDGDILYIPEFMQTVKVSGMVQNPYSISYREGKNAKFYIEQTGGFDSEAIKRKVYVQYANGYTATTKSVLGIKSYPKVTPGSEVIVPQKPEKKPGNSGQWMALASVLASLAVSFATVVSLSK